MRIVIFGTGSCGKLAYQQFRRNPLVEVLAFADNDIRKHGTVLDGIAVIAPTEIFNYAPERVVIASMYEEEIRQQLEKELGLPPLMVGGTLDAYVRECRRLCAADMIDEADQIATQAAQLYDVVIVGAVRAECLLARKERRQAATELESAITALEPLPCGNMYERLVRAYNGLFDFDQARQAVQRGLLNSPRHLGIRVAEADIEMSLQNWKEAIRKFRSLITDCKDRASGYMFQRLALAHRLAGDAEGGTIIARQGIARFPQSVPLLLAELELHVLQYSLDSARLKQDVESFCNRHDLVLTGGMRVRAANLFKALNCEREANALFASIVKREDIPKEQSRKKQDLARVKNVLRYTKSSGEPYAAINFPAGYHTIQIDEDTIKGRRSPNQRIDGVPFDFTGKSVLDIGSNQGGMLFAVAEAITWGVGIDYDSRMVNAANVVRSVMQANNLHFFTFNLETEDLNTIRDYLPTSKVDIVFLLAVCRWISTWRDVLDFADRISPRLLFESNGSSVQQQEQIQEIQSRYASAQLLRSMSPDDPERADRQLFFCEGPVRRSTPYMPNMNEKGNTT